MSKLLLVCGIVLVAIGVALGIASVASPAQMQIYGLTPETAAVLLTGGILALGLGSLIDAVARAPASVVAAPPTIGLNQELPPFRPRSFDSGIAVPAVIATGAATAVATAKEAASSISVAETIEALEQAKSDIKAALGGAPAFEPPANESIATEVNAPLLPVKVDTPEPVAPPPAAELEEVEEPDSAGLYVVEEQVVRGKPARVLSDGTVEAETDEGWMRFENMEHLNEYLDSLG